MAGHLSQVSQFTRLLVVVGLFATACVAPSSSPQQGTRSGAPASSASTTTVLLATTTTLTTPTTTMTTPIPPGITAVRTPTGVNVAVLGQRGTHLIVRTPCGNDAEISSGHSLGEITVVLDPGHGGPVDTGAIGSNGLVERDLNLAVAQTARDDLSKRGIPTALTRTGDYPSRLEERAGFADHVGAEVLVSIHHNSPAPGPSPLPGTEVFIQSDSAESRRLGQLVWEHVHNGLAVFEDVSWSAAPDVGVLRVLNTRGSDAYGMIRHPDTISVLAELAYLNNPSEARLMATPEYVETAAGLVVDAIEAYLTTDDRGSGFVDEPRVFDPNPGISSDACEDPELE